MKLTSYAPNRLTYDVSTTKGGVIVFAENYYPGWTALVDGKEVEIGRVNYVLRAISVTAGRHKVELSFFPKTVNTTEYIAYAAYVVILLAILLLVFLYVRKKES